MFLQEDKHHMLDLKGCFPEWAIWLLLEVHAIDGGKKKEKKKSIYLYETYHAAIT